MIIILKGRKKNNTKTRIHRAYYKVEYARRLYKTWKKDVNNKYVLATEFGTILMPWWQCNENSSNLMIDLAWKSRIASFLPAFIAKYQIPKQ